MSAPLVEAIGPFRVLRPIARGGTAWVYEVQDSRSGEHLALKMLMAPRARKRFDREYEAMIRLNHPSIVHVYEYGEHEGTPWFTMELVKGTPIQAYARHLGRPGTEGRLREVVRAGRDIALALDHIHYRGLVHRDLKSANVLVLPDGRIKLIDFGTARVRDALEEITRHNEFVGTFAYAAPEQIRNKGVGPQSDLYSLGILLYRLCTGKRPFHAEDVRELARMQLHEQPRPPRELTPRIPRYLESIIEALLHKDPAERPPRGRNVAASLEKVFEEELTPPGELSISGSSLVGREEQLLTVRGVLRSRSPGDLVTITGPRGSGRAELVEAVLDEVRADHWRVLRADLSPAHEEEQVLAMLWELGHAFGRQGRSSTVLRALRVLDTVESSQHLSRSRRAEAIIVAGSALLAEWSQTREQPLLVVLDELQRASGTTMELLGEARDRVARGPCPVLFLASLEGTHELARPLFAESTRVELSPLGPREVALLTGALLHRRPPPATVASRLHHASGGLPVYLGQVLERMVHSRSLRVRGRALERLEWAREELEIPVPPEARALILDDLTVLPVEGRRLLEALSILEGEASLRLLARALSRRRGEIQPMVDRLIREGWVVADDTGIIRWYRTLAAEVVQGLLHPCRRGVYTRRILAILEPEEASPTLMVRLCLEDGQVQRAGELALAGTEQLMADELPHTALEMLEPLMERLDESLPADLRARLLIAYASCVQVARPTDAAAIRTIKLAEDLDVEGTAASLRLARARTQQTIGHYPNYRKLLLEAWKASNAEERPMLATDIAQHLAEDARMAGNPKDTEYWYRTARDLSLASGDPTAATLGDLGVAAWLYSRGSLRDAEAWVHRIQMTQDQLDTLRGRWLALALWTDTLRQQGRYSEALRSLEAALPALAEGQSLVSYLMILVCTAWCEVDLCRLGRAQEYVDEIGAILRRGEYLHLRVQADLVRGRILSASGLDEDAESVLRGVVDRSQAAGLVLVSEHARALRAEALWNLDRRREAADAFYLSTRRLAKAGNVPALMEACTAQARVMAADLDPERIFSVVEPFLKGQPFYPARLERILARAWHQAARGGEPSGALRAAELQLDLIRQRLEPAEAVALRLHPWLRRIRKGGLP